MGIYGRVVKTAEGMHGKVQSGEGIAIFGIRLIDALFWWRKAYRRTAHAPSLALAWRYGGAADLDIGCRGTCHGAWMARCMEESWRTRLDDNLLLGSDERIQDATDFYDSCRKNRTGVDDNAVSDSIELAGHSYRYHVLSLKHVDKCREHSNLRGGWFRKRGIHYTKSPNLFYRPAVEI